MGRSEEARCLTALLDLLSRTPGDFRRKPDNGVGLAPQSRCDIEARRRVRAKWGLNALFYP
jgi:hypothetical protein